MPLTARSFAYWDGKDFAVESDNVDIRVGGSSDAIALHEQIKVGE
jgi:hypothetical protein